MSSAEARPRLLLVSIDAADGELVRRWMVEGRLPTLSALAARGTQLPLRSQGHRMPEAAWPSMSTGCGPGKHGVYHWRMIQPETGTAMAVDHSGWRRPFWWVLRHHGPQPAPEVVLVDIPFTVPLGDDGVTELSGWSLRVTNKGRSWPPELFAQASQRFPPAPGWLDRDYDRSAFSNWRYRRTLERLADRRTDLALSLLESRPWDCAFVNYTEPHYAAHAFFHLVRQEAALPDSSEAGSDGGALLAVYRAVDDGLARLIEAAGDDVNVLAFSPMGLSPNKCSEHLLKDILIALGFQVPARAPASTRRLQAAGWVATTLVPRAVRHRLKALVPGGIVEDVAERSWREGIDWSRSRAVAEPQLSDGWIRLNLGGREPDGIVDPAEKDALLEEITAELQALEEVETGVPAVARVIRPLTLMPGPRTDSFPDLVVEWRPGGRIRSVRHPRVGVVSDITGHVPPTEHNNFGFLVAAGPSIEPGTTDLEAQEVDLAPTALHLLGCPVPEDVDGTVLEQLLRGEEPVCRVDIDLSVDPFSQLAGRPSGGS